MDIRGDVYEHLSAFPWHVGSAGISDEEAKLRDLAAMKKEVEQMIMAAGVEARAAGVSWQKIGDSLGISRQAATMRFSPEGKLF